MDSRPRAAEFADEEPGSDGRRFPVMGAAVVNELCERGVGQHGRDGKYE